MNKSNNFIVDNKKTYKQARNVKHYVDNEKFHAAILEYREKVKQAIKDGKPEPPLTNYIGESIYKIADRLSYSPRFINYSYRDECVAEAIYNSIKYFHNYDPEYIAKNGKKSPFTYFTQVAYYSFFYVINKEERNRYIRYKNFDNTMILNGNKDLLIDEENNLIPSSTYDNIATFIESFEKREKIKKEKRKEMKDLKDAEKRDSITATDTTVD